MCDIIFKTDPMFGRFALTKNKHFKCDMSHVSYVLTKNIPSHMCDIIFKTDLIFARFVLTKKYPMEDVSKKFSGLEDSF